MMQKILEVFDGELEVGNIRKIASYEYEIDSFGYNYYYGGWKIPIGTFSMMMEYGMNNIRIMNSQRIDNEYMITIRFTVNEKQLDDRLERDREWNKMWAEFNQRRENDRISNK